MEQYQTITYIFNTKEECKELSIKLDKQTLEFIQPAPQPSVQWTKLDFCRCTNCTLDSSKYEHCPVALGIMHVISGFGNCSSTSIADIHVITENREYRKQDTIEKGLSSCIGLVMVTAGCPFLNMLRPMAYTHLPFATPRETTYRAVSMYLLAQYFLQRKEKKADWKMKKLAAIYTDIRIVNQCFARRIKAIGFSEANVDSLVRLDCFATAITLSLVSDWWDEIEAFFAPYLE
ncbi:MAG: hypothetical protein GF350_13695 [Chitinivibrionales bacterium]|nr:hypothetical protein [Chitinivibrionales bacterium]